MSDQDHAAALGRLSYFWNRGDDDRVVVEAYEILGQSPENQSAHYFACLSLSRLDRHREARHHLDLLLRAAPESVEARYAAVFFFVTQSQWSKARPHIEAGLRLDPDATAFLTWAAITDLKEMKFKSARQHIARARRLEPDDPEIVNLHIRIHAAEEQSTSAALRRLSEYEASLRLYPENASIHNSIGDVYLDQLDAPADAERHYRIALAVEPGNSNYQQDLFHAVAKRSVIYRLFSIPSRTFAWLKLLAYACTHQPWRIIIFLIAAKFVLCFFIWLFLATLVFWPGGKIYEWLLVSEMKTPGKASLRGMRLWHQFRSIPIWLRFLGFLAVNLVLWAGLFRLLSIPLVTGCLFVAIFAGIHLAVIVFLWLLRKASNTVSRRSRAKRLPPPLPKQV